LRAKFMTAWSAISGRKISNLAGWHSGRRRRWLVPDQPALAAFPRSGAFLRGHFVYTSGRHGADYLEKFRILEDPAATATLAGHIAARFKDLDPGLVAGPTTGGVLLAYEVARQLGIKAVYAEAGERGRVLRRGFQVA